MEVEKNIYISPSELMFLQRCLSCALFTSDFIMSDDDKIEWINLHRKFLHLVKS